MPEQILLDAKDRLAFEEDLEMEEHVEEDEIDDEDAVDEEQDHEGEKSRASVQHLVPIWLWFTIYSVSMFWFSSYTKFPLR